MKSALTENISHLAPDWTAKIKQSNVIKVYITMVTLYLLSGILETDYFSMDHIMQTLVIASFLGIVAMGQTLVVLTGGIDLSVAYALNLGAVMMTQITSEMGGAAAAVIVIITGLMIGLGNGLGVAYLKISPMIMTLAMNSILKSVTYVYTDGTPKGSAPEWLRFLGTGSVLGIKAAVIVWIILAVIVLVLLSKTAFGRKIYALGNSESTAYLSGINNKRVIICLYALSGMFAAIAGMMMTGFSGLAYLGMGDALQLSSVAAVVIGGTSILGGKGGYSGTMAGAVIIYLLLSILQVLDMKDAGRQIIYGMVILVVLFIYGRQKDARA
ncbi:ABC transporter permease [Petroclostridium sp. X23]|uniref:ABC transporter permease n=1 Tax=Petroclostridium sp. X23 TaxID=3045146 RepID=UPI0024AC8C1C|nr:ABC transporter permease [Petroclostridium sp. X23]WHH60369.1 ABC transporter permease [Petroclostridium sp. X23]